MLPFGTKETTDMYVGLLSLQYCMAGKSGVEFNLADGSVHHQN